MIDLVRHADGVLLPVRAQPGARRSAVVGEHAGALKVAVTQAPEKGKANKALIQLLAKELQVSKSQIELIAGETSRQKQFLIRGAQLNQIASRLTQLLG